MFKPLSIIGIGSVPFVEGRNACEEIFNQWDIPFWPQYPARSLRENFIYQFLSRFPGLKVSENSASFDESQYLRKKKHYREMLERAACHCEATNPVMPKQSHHLQVVGQSPRLLRCARNDEDDEFFFEPPSAWALGYSQMKELLDEGAVKKKTIKLQVTGPQTIWDSFFQKRISADLSKEIWELLNLTLAAAGLAQVRRILSHRKNPLLFIDEPIFTDDIASLRKMAALFRKNGALVGLHVCSNPSWERLSDLDLDVFHFDLAGSSELNPLQRNFIRKHLNSGGWIAWGVVPTDSRVGTPDRVKKLIKEIEKAADKELFIGKILGRSLLSASCGTGTLKFEQGQGVFHGLQAIALKLKSKNLKIDLTLSK